MTTAAENAILRAIADFTEYYGWPPTLRELAADLGMFAHSSVDYHLRRLRDQGLVDWEDGKARTLRVVEPLTAPQERA